MRNPTTDEAVRAIASATKTPSTILWGDQLQAAHPIVKKIALKKAFAGQPWPSTN
jgi:hypothetical protein